METSEHPKGVRYPVQMIGFSLRQGILLRHVSSFVFSLFPALLNAAESSEVIDTAQRYVRLQTQGLPGQVKIVMGRLDVSRLPPCSTHEAFSPQGVRLIGKTHVGVRCLGPNLWSVLAPVQISLIGNYITTSRPVAAGQTVTARDLAILSGDLTTLPTGVVTNPQSVIGKTLRNSLGGGQPLRGDQLLEPLVIHQGQIVRVISLGVGFIASAEGKALNNASSGQLTRVRLNAGQTVSGIARVDGSVEIRF